MIIYFLSTKFPLLPQPFNSTGVLVHFDEKQSQWPPSQQNITLQIISVSYKLRDELK